MTCKNWSPKTAPAMGKLWLAPCLLGPIWNYTPPQWRCNNHTPATAEVQAARVAWLERAV